MLKFRAQAILASSLLVAAAAVHAAGVQVGLATVSQVDGVVLVSDGGRFSTATIGSPLADGNRLLTMENAAATVTYGDGCQLDVSPNTMVVFREANECTTGKVDSEATGQKYASLGSPTSAVAASAGTVATTTAAVSSSGAIGSRPRGEPGLFGVPAAGVVAGVGVAGVLGYFVVNDSNNNDNNRNVTTPETR